MREGNERKPTKGAEKRGRGQSTQMEGNWSGTINIHESNRLDTPLPLPLHSTPGLALLCGSSSFTAFSSLLLKPLLLSLLLHLFLFLLFVVVWVFFFFCSCSCSCFSVCVDILKFE